MHPVRFVYLHGFASSPRSEKATLFRERLARRSVSLDVLDLNEPDFELLTLSRNLEHLDRALPEGTRGIVIGSSMGGYSAALFATRHPERVEALVLMAPAFNLARLLVDRHGHEAMERWRAEESVAVEHPNFDEPMPLSYGFQADAERWDEVEVDVRCPTLVFHGLHDEEVPVEASRRFARGRENVELLELDADHSLLGPIERIWSTTEKFVEPWLPTAA